MFTATAGWEALGVSLTTVAAGGAFTAGLGVFEGAGAVWGGACCLDGADLACLPWDFSSPKAEATRAIIVKATARTKTSATRLDSKIDAIMIWLLSNSSRFSIAKRLYS